MYCKRFFINVWFSFYKYFYRYWLTVPLAGYSLTMGLSHCFHWVSFFVFLRQEQKSQRSTQSSTPNVSWSSSATSLLSSRIGSLRVCNWQEFSSLWRGCGSGETCSVNTGVLNLHLLDNWKTVHLGKDSSIDFVLWENYSSMVIPSHMSAPWHSLDFIVMLPH